jgi:hypothetical protein
MRDDDDFLAEDVEFERKTAQELYYRQFGDDPNIAARWDRLRTPTEFRFVDLVNRIHDGRATVGAMMSCPFHGRDSHPSFKIYKNDAFCWGCPTGSGFYDSVGFVAAKFQITKIQAIRWLEKAYDLPQLDVVEEEEDEETEDGPPLTFADLAPTYIQFIARQFRQDPTDLEMIHDGIRTYFEAKPGPKEKPDSVEALERARDMANILGEKLLEKIKRDAHAKA